MMFWIDWKRFNYIKYLFSYLTHDVLNHTVILHSYRNNEEDHAFVMKDQWLTFNFFVAVSLLRRLARGGLNVPLNTRSDSYSVSEQSMCSGKFWSLLLNVLLHVRFREGATHSIQGVFCPCSWIGIPVTARQWQPSQCLINSLLHYLLSHYLLSPDLSKNGIHPWLSIFFTLWMQSQLLGPF